MLFCVEKARTNTGRIAAILFLFVFLSKAAPEQYKIDSYSYELEKTKFSAVEKKIDVDTKRVFEDSDSFQNYLKELEQNLINTRTFDTIEITCEELGAQEDYQEDDIKHVSLRISLTDSKHLLVVPYPKYDSNDGLTVKIKAKDTNFAGTMSELNFDINAGMKEDEYDEGKSKFAGGFNFAYDYPFSLGMMNAFWKNSVEFEYINGRKKPDFSAATGFLFDIPFEHCSIQLELSESAHHDLEYKEYSDELYATSIADLFIPIKIGSFSFIRNVVWGPFSNFTANYDANTIHKNNDDLSGPVLSFGHRFKSENINWYGNFRNGYSILFSQSMGYNFLSDKYQPKMEIEFEAFKAFKNCGINMRFISFFSDTSRKKIGSYLRGIKDDQKYSLTTKKALKVPSAMILNLDLPFHVISTDWERWIGIVFGTTSSAAEKLTWMHKLDFEVQFSPFIDAALTKNEYTGNNFFAKDGWYGAGLEVLVFPKKWKNIVVRASCGVDIGQAFISKHTKRFYDSSWREDGVSKKELYVGIGLHY